MLLNENRKSYVHEVISDLKAQMNYVEHKI